MKMIGVGHFLVLASSLSLASALSEVGPLEGYQQLGLNYYKIHGEVAPSWEKAREICISEGGHLAVLNSEEESYLLSKLFDAANVTTGVVAYIGFHDMFVEGLYVTIFDQPLNEAGFNRWALNEPGPGSASEVEDCGAINRFTGGLHDISCGAAIPFICERV